MKFKQTFCSQCGGAFGPGDAGFSHCDQHASLQDLQDIISPTVEKVMRQFESALTRKQYYGPPSKH